MGPISFHNTRTEFKRVPLEMAAGKGLNIPLAHSASRPFVPLRRPTNPFRFSFVGYVDWLRLSIKAVSPRFEICRERAADVMTWQLLRRRHFFVIRIRWTAAEPVNSRYTAYFFGCLRRDPLPAPKPLDRSSPKLAPTWLCPNFLIITRQAKFI